MRISHVRIMRPENSSLVVSSRLGDDAFTVIVVAGGFSDAEPRLALGGEAQIDLTVVVIAVIDNHLADDLIAR
jgi:hypothetical protein